MTKKIILIGAGGHSKVIQDIIKASKELILYAVLDDVIDHTTSQNGIIYSNISFVNEIKKDDYKYCIAIGNNEIRKVIYERLNIPSSYFITLIHPSAIISNSAQLGYGTVVMPNAVINADVGIGNHCIINTGAIVEHDNKIDQYVHISPNATLSGTVFIGEGAHIGAGATVIPGKTVGKWTNIGAGAVVIDDIEGNVTAVGVPARVLK